MRRSGNYELNRIAVFCARLKIGNILSSCAVPSAFFFACTLFRFGKHMTKVLLEATQQTATTSKTVERGYLSVSTRKKQIQYNKMPFNTNVITAASRAM